MNNTEAGWYPDPQNPTELFRYWDGSQWTDNTSPQNEPQPAAVGASVGQPGGDAQPAPMHAAAPGVAGVPTVGAAAPAAAVARGTGTTPGGLATIGRRIGGACIDATAWFVAMFVAGMLGAATGNETIAGVMTALGVLSVLGAQVYFAFTSAQTVGKKLLAMQVVDKDSRQPLSGGRYVFVRGLLGGLIGSIPLVGFVLLFMPLWDEWNQSVGGKVSNSIVIDVP